MIRATTGGVLKTYRMNLMNSFISSNKARDTVLTQRNFNSYAEDPAAAAKAFKLRKSRMSVESQHDVSADTYRKYASAFSCLDTIDNLIDTEDGSEMKTLTGTTLKMLNDPTGDAREQLTKALDQMSQSIVQNLNQKYGDNFIFAGADGHNVPFTIENDKLYYRGVPVDADVPELYDDNGAQVKLNADGQVDTNGSSFLLSTGVQTISETSYTNNQNDPAAEKIEVLMDANDPTKPYAFTDKDGNTYYIVKDSAQAMTQKEIDKATEDAEKMKYLLNEKQFVDIGLGFQENENSKLIESSAYNAALHGVTFIGYGLDEDGDPKNIYSLVQEMRKIAESVPDGEMWSNETWEDFDALVKKLEKASSAFKTEFTNMDAGTQKLKNNTALLEDNFYNLQEQYSDLEDVDMADAITSFVWAQYCYNAALKVGNSVLSESLMDYLS